MRALRCNSASVVAKSISCLSSICIGMLLMILLGDTAHGEPVWNERARLMSCVGSMSREARGSQIAQEMKERIQAIEDYYSEYLYTMFLEGVGRQADCEEGEDLFVSVSKSLFMHLSTTESTKDELCRLVLRHCESLDAVFLMDKLVYSDPKLKSIWEELRGHEETPAFFLLSAIWTSACAGKSECLSAFFQARETSDGLYAEFVVDKLIELVLEHAPVVDNNSAEFIKFEEETSAITGAFCEYATEEQIETFENLYSPEGEMSNCKVLYERIADCRSNDDTSGNS